MLLSVEQEAHLDDHSPVLKIPAVAKPACLAADDSALRWVSRISTSAAQFSCKHLKRCVHSNRKS